jgi:hypothetical protein
MFGVPPHQGQIAAAGVGTPEITSVMGGETTFKTSAQNCVVITLNPRAGFPVIRLRS